MLFTTIVSEGNLIPADLLAQIAAGAIGDQQPADFGFEQARRLTDEIAVAWADVKVYWEAFQHSLRRLRDDVAILRESPRIPKDIPISGAIYAVTIDKVHEVVRA